MFYTTTSTNSRARPVSTSKPLSTRANYWSKYEQTESVGDARRRRSVWMSRRHEKSPSPCAQLNTNGGPFPHLQTPFFLNSAPIASRAGARQHTHGRPLGRYLTPVLFRLDPPHSLRDGEGAGEVSALRRAPRAPSGPASQPLFSAPQGISSQLMKTPQQQLWSMKECRNGGGSCLAIPACVPVGRALFLLGCLAGCRTTRTSHRPHSAHNLSRFGILWAPQSNEVCTCTEVFLSEEG